MTTTKTTTSFFAQHLNRVVLNGMLAMSMSINPDKQGTIKSGEKAPYITLRGDDGTDVNLHPQNALTLMKTGNYKTFTMLDDIAGGEEVNVQVEAIAPVDVTPTVVAEVVTAPTDDVEYDLGASYAPMNENFSEFLVDETPKKVNKREMTEELYMAGHKVGSKRKDIIGLMKSQLGMSDAGANTYYQNAHTKLKHHFA